MAKCLQWQRFVMWGLECTEGGCRGGEPWLATCGSVSPMTSCSNQGAWLCFEQQQCLIWTTQTSSRWPYMASKGATCTCCPHATLQTIIDHALEVPARATCTHPAAQGRAQALTLWLNSQCARPTKPASPAHRIALLRLALGQLQLRCVHKLEWLCRCSLPGRDCMLQVLRGVDAY